MTHKYLHEAAYRGWEAIAKLSQPQVTICGVGALGSHLADNLARQGFRRLRVIDHDRVEEHNVGTQLYGLTDVGAAKVEVLRNHLFRTSEIEVEAHKKELNERTGRSLLKGSDLVVDTLDNHASRKLVQDQCRERQIACLHVGLHADYCEAIWDEQYRVPNDAEGDVCAYPLARNLVLLAVALGSELLIRYILEGRKQNFSATLGDFALSELEPPRLDALEVVLYPSDEPHRTDTAVRENIRKQSPFQAEFLSVRPGIHELRNLAILKIVFTRLLINSNCLTGPCPRVLPQVHDGGLASRANCASESRLAWLSFDPAKG